MLTGSDLLAKVKELGDVSKSDLVRSCGYSLRGHQRGIDAAGSMAQAMGHSFEVHCRSYPWASAAGTIAAFQRANEATAMASIA